jgi:hypothetical protein
MADQKLKPGAFLDRRDMENINAREANLERASMRGANLRFANLYGANLKEADLGETNMRLASLVGANLTGAYLGCANLTSADFTRANLTGADLTGANLRSATLTGANITGTKLPPFQIVPQVGQFRAFKKVVALTTPLRLTPFVLELLIPRSAQRTSTPISRKCRASKAKVVRVVNPEPQWSAITQFHSLHDHNFTYEIGKWVVPSEEYDGDIRVECTQGIHFFMTYEEAAEYVY